MGRYAAGYAVWLMDERMTPRDRNLMAGGALALVVIGVAGQFSVWWAAIVMGTVGLAAALVLAYVAVR